MMLMKLTVIIRSLQKEELLTIMFIIFGRNKLHCKSFQFVLLFHEFYTATYCIFHDLGAAQSQLPELINLFLKIFFSFFRATWSLRLGRLWESKAVLV